MSCSHKGCHCDDATVEREGKNFCSDRCADAALASPSSGVPACDCGHAGCGAI